jgi:hypothetical protein
MFNFFITPKKERVGFEDMKTAIRSQLSLLINTLSISEQQCLIFSTIAYDKEEYIINNILDSGDTTIDIIVYGKHSVDETPYTKQKQLRNLGFKNVYVYSGGLFEWLLLQDIYGATEFPTTQPCKDLLAYRPVPLLTTKLPTIMF